MNLLDYVDAIREDGLKLERARVKTCQDILMYKLKNTKYINNITFKGGTIMYQLSKDIRRSTADVDIDVIKLIIDNDNLTKVFNEIGKENDSYDFSFSVNEKLIKPLSHEAYDGKRIFLRFKDKEKNTLTLKLDIGVHKDISIDQNSIMFFIKESSDSIEVLCNPPEQMIVEKTSSFIKYGEFSTRMKDIYDIYFLVNTQDVDKNKIKKIIKLLYIDNGKISTFNEFQEEMQTILESKIIKSKLDNSMNWLDIDNDKILNNIIEFLNSL